VVDAELVVGVEHHQVLGVGTLGDFEHGGPDRQGLPPMGKGHDLDRCAFALGGARRYRDRVIAGSVVGDEDLTERRGIRCAVASDGRDGLLDPAGLVECRHDHGDRGSLLRHGRHVYRPRLATRPYVSSRITLDVVLTTLPPTCEARCHGIVHASDGGATGHDRGRGTASTLPDETLADRTHQYVSGPR